MNFFLVKIPRFIYSAIFLVLYSKSILKNVLNLPISQIPIKKKSTQTIFSNNLLKNKQNIVRI